MARRGRPGGRSTVRQPASIDGVLVRVPIGPGHWAEEIPPVPLGFDVTVSFGSPMAADEHRDALELLGYRVVDLPSGLGDKLENVADFLVTESLMEHHPTYWRSLATQAVRAYHLGLGPAAAMVGDVVAVHAMTLAR